MRLAVAAQLSMAPTYSASYTMSDTMPIRPRPCGEKLDQHMAGSAIGCIARLVGITTHDSAELGLLAPSGRAAYAALHGGLGQGRVIGGRHRTAGPQLGL